MCGAARCGPLALSGGCQRGRGLSGAALFVEYAAEGRLRPQRGAAGLQHRRALRLPGRPRLLGRGLVGREDLLVLPARGWPRWLPRGAHAHAHGCGDSGHRGRYKLDGSFGNYDSNHDGDHGVAATHNLVNNSHDYAARCADGPVIGLQRHVLLLPDGRDLQ